MLRAPSVLRTAQMKPIEHIKSYCWFWKPSVARRITLYFLIFGLINILLLILGCFIPPAAVILMVAHLLLPIIKGLGFDPIWFAVIMTVNLEIGLVTPPVGLNLYIVKNIAPDIPMSHVLLGVIPFVIIEGLVIVCVCIWPELALWLPNKMIG